MEFNIISGMNLLNPTPIWYYKARENKIDHIQSELDEAYQSIEFDNDNSTSNNIAKPHGVSDPTFTKSILHEKNCTSLINEIDYNTVIFCEMMGLSTDDPYTYDASWFAKFKPGDFANNHRHTPSDIAGVYYYKISGEQSGLNVECSNPLIDSNYVTCSPFGGATEFPAEVGTILLFPGYVPHFVSQNRTDEDRVSVSFNLTFTR